MFYNQDIKFIIDTLADNGYDAYAVGGCVRDMLLSIQPKDYDICTSALPQQVKRCFLKERVVETGIEHGTVTLVLGEKRYEITTYRADGSYTDGRRPDSVKFLNSLKEDLRRRDFTVNAMAYSDSAGVIDYFGGREDLKKGIVAAVGKADERLSQDALRVLRGLRFASVYGFKIEEDTAKSMMKNRYLLKNIAAERIRKELIKMLLGRDIEKILIEYGDIFKVIIPQLSPCFGFDQKTPYHRYDVWHHTAVAVGAAADSAVVRIALLLHDIGKPQSFSIDEKGIGHFYGHASISAEIAKEVVCGLRFDNRMGEEIVQLVKYHDVLILDDKKTVKRWLNRLGYEGFKNLIYLKQADITAQGNSYREQRLKECSGLLKTAQQIIEQEDCISLKTLNINGADLIGIGYKQGKEIGKLLADILSKVMDEELRNERDNLIEYARKQYANRTIEQ